MDLEPGAQGAAAELTLRPLSAVATREMCVVPFNLEKCMLHPWVGHIYVTIVIEKVLPWYSSVPSNDSQLGAGSALAEGTRPNLAVSSDRMRTTCPRLAGCALDKRREPLTELKPSSVETRACPAMIVAAQASSRPTDGRGRSQPSAPTRSITRASQEQMSRRS